MPAKRGLITDTFKVVKRARTRDQKPPSPPESEPEIPVISERERDLQELKTFDLDWHFGPCIGTVIHQSFWKDGIEFHRGSLEQGISRLQRWERAALHGLDPPREIKELLQSNEDDPEYTQCLWRDYPL